MSKELLALMNQLELKRFARSRPKKRLYRIFHETEMKRHYGRMGTWDLLVELLAKWLVRNGKLTSPVYCSENIGNEL